MSKKRKLKTQTKQSNKQGGPNSRSDIHHIWFQRRHYQQGWAKVLREHWYCKILIPQATLHRELHSKIHDVPTPNGDICRSLVNDIDLLYEKGIIGENDTPLMRVTIISNLLSRYKGLSATKAVINWQLEVIWKLYRRQSENPEDNSIL